MTPSLKRKLKAAMDAIETVFSDTTGPLRSTLEALQELQTDLEMKTGAIKVDIRRAQAGGQNDA